MVAWHEFHATEPCHHIKPLFYKVIIAKSGMAQKKNDLNIYKKSKKIKVFKTSCHLPPRHLGYVKPVTASASLLFGLRKD